MNVEIQADYTLTVKDGAPIQELLDTIADLLASFAERHDGHAVGSLDMVEGVDDG